MINIFTLTDNVLELKVNEEKYIVYMHFSGYWKLLAARIFATLELINKSQNAATEMKLLTVNI